MTEIAAAQVESAVAQLMEAKVQQAVTQAVEEQVKALFAAKDGPVQKGLVDAVQWRLQDMLPGVAAAAVDETIWRQLDQGGPLKDAMEQLATEVTDVLSNLEAMMTEQKAVTEAQQKVIDDRLNGLSQAPRAMQDAVRRAVQNQSTMVADPAEKNKQFTPGGDDGQYLGPIEIDAFKPVAPVQQQAAPAEGEGNTDNWLGDILADPA
jgi:ElaB/YqjD/DUF883 family membrane-anchored ribosome-binding protein